MEIICRHALTILIPHLKAMTEFSHQLLTCMSRFQSRIFHEGYLVNIVLQRQDFLQALVSYHFINASLSIDMRGATSGGPKHRDHYCIHCAPLLFSRMFQESPVLNARHRTSFLNALIISIGSTCAEPRAQLEPNADKVSGRKIHVLSQHTTYNGQLTILLPVCSVS
jgi:hypothetical protein